MTTEKKFKVSSESIVRQIKRKPRCKYSPAELGAHFSEWVDHYNNQRYHESIDNVTPSDRFFGRDKEILEQRQRTKTETMRQRRKIYRLFLMNNLIEGLS